MNNQNDLYNKPKNSFKFITGPMFSGKTTSLIKEIKYYQKQLKFNVLIFKMTLDNRNKDYKHTIATHNKICYKAISVENLKEIENMLNKIKTNPEIIFFSEAHLFPKEFHLLIEKILQKNIKIILAGLTYDYQKKVFPTIEKLLNLKPKIKNLYSNCYLCFKKAPWSKRLTNDRSVILIGGSDKYAPICTACFDKK